MTALGYLVAALFLPLFPFSMLFNRLLARFPSVRSRMGLFLLWPQPGVLMLGILGERPPAWMVWWAAATSLLYALRGVAVRDSSLWTGYMATSAWALLWPAAAFGAFTEGGAALAWQAIGLSVPFLLVAWLAGRLESELGAAYAGLCGGLAQTMPRLSGLLVLGVLAAVGTPPVPGFFTLLATTIHALPVSPGVALVTVTVWLLWTWSGIRILQGLVVGPACADSGPDLGSDLRVTAARLLGLAFAVLVLAGIGISGELT